MVDESAPTNGTFRRRLIFNTAATAASSGWTIVLTIVSVPVLLDGLGVESFGLWALLQTFSAVTGWLSLSDLGLGLAATRHVAGDSSREDRAARDLGIGTTLWLFVGLGVGFGAVVAAAGPWLFVSAFNVPAELEAAARFAVVAFGAQIAMELLMSGAVACLDGLQRVDLSRAADAVRRTVVLGAAALTAYAGGGLEGVAVAAAIANAVAAVVSLGLLRSEAGSIPWRWSRSVARELLTYGRSVWSLGVSGVLHRTMDRVIVGVMLGPVAVALVEIANLVYNGVASVLGAFTYTMTSGAAWVHSRESPAHLRELVMRGTKYATVATIPVCAVVAVLATPLITAWLGSEQDEAADLVRLALLYLASQAPLAVGTNVLIGTGRAGHLVRPAILAALINLCLSVLLVDRVGVEGALWATVISGFVLTPLLLGVLARDLAVGPAALFREAISPAAVPTIGGSAVALVVLATAWGPLVTTLVGGLAGLTASAVLIARVTLEPDERSELLRTISR